MLKWFKKTEKTVEEDEETDFRLTSTARVWMSAGGAERRAASMRGEMEGNFATRCFEQTNRLLNDLNKRK